MKRQTDTGEGVNDAQRGARAILDNAMSEAQWQELVIEAANRANYLCHHQLIPIKKEHGRTIAWVTEGTRKGFPDLVLCRPPEEGDTRGEFFVCELKRESGKLTPEQEVWREVLQAAGVRYYLWRPSDWPQVCRVLGLPDDDVR